MPSERHTRLLLLVELAAVGVVLAGVGTAFGVDGVQSQPSAEFVVADENVTVAQANQSETVVTNFSNVTEVRIDRADDSRFTVETLEQRPLSPTERERAREIALDNQTVSQAVNDVAAPGLTVEPIRKLNASRTISRNVSVVAGDGDSPAVDAADGDTFVVELDDTDGGNGAVMVSRTPDYVADLAVVRVRDRAADPSTDLQYTVRVDLANGTVTDVTDWTRLRGNTTRALPRLQTPPARTCLSTR